MGPSEPNIAEIEIGAEATAGIKLRDGHPEAQNKGRHNLLEVGAALGGQIFPARADAKRSRTKSKIPIP
jgi:hypothetical protein